MDGQVYQRAERFLPWNLHYSVFNSTIFPYWTSEALYYFQQSKLGKSLLRIDIKTGIKEKILDFQEIINIFYNQVKVQIDVFQLKKTLYDYIFKSIIQTGVII